ncbi:DNA glycosylase AlkZ-like family protein [Kribbella sp. NPDC048928]|uniref:DNA glycosylase AlkZ-like family protein n=1 Tax=Kribbella sp. NPDC048928 TaxID=3364111 RepID=UPI00371F0E1D
MRIVTREQAIAYRLRVNNLVDRLPTGSYEQAAYAGLQDTGPRDALLGLHARMAGCTPGDWEHPALLQTYSPRAAVYVLPARDFGVFTLGRLPLDPTAVRRINALADRVCKTLADRQSRNAAGSSGGGDGGGGGVRGAGVEGLRAACATGRIAVRWDTTSLYAREVPRPALDVHEARLELCRRHIEYFGPTTPKTYAWWSGLSPADARAVWDQLASELVEVDFDGVPAWVLQTAEHNLHTAPPPRGVRLLVSSDLRLFGRDRDARFIAPGLRQLIPTADWFHPHGLLIDGDLVGAWGRKSGHVTVVLAKPLTPAQHTALEVEVASLPTRNPRLSVQ